jgi:hypothetical protein
MDLERDKYIAVVPAHRLAHWVRGWPVGAVQTKDSAHNPDGTSDALVSQMLAHGMLVTDPHFGKPAEPVTTPRPQRCLVELDLDTRAQASAGQLWRFGRSWLQAKLSLKLRPIQSIVEAVRDRKARLAAREQDVDPVRLRSLVIAFTRLRPLFYTLRGACLLDSLTLMHFLSAEGIHSPDWVFGVKTEPFDAHCWVQQGEVVLNDVPDRVRQYSAILVV